MHAVETALLETAQDWEQDACAGAEVREIIGAVDETFLERMLLVCMDLRTGLMCQHFSGQKISWVFKVCS